MNGPNFQQSKVVGGFRMYFEQIVWDTDQELVWTATVDLDYALNILPRLVKEKLQVDTEIYVYADSTSVGRYHLVGDIHQFRGCITISSIHHMKHKMTRGKGGIFVHEFAHAVHDKLCVGGIANAGIKEAYSKAMSKGLYNSVLTNTLAGTGMGGAYACTDCLEFFAELSTAYLWHFDAKKEYGMYYPFNRAQLKKHDFESFQVIEREWLRFGDNTDSPDDRALKSDEKKGGVARRAATESTAQNKAKTGNQMNGSMNKAKRKNFLSRFWFLICTCEKY